VAPTIWSASQSDSAVYKERTTLHSRVKLAEIRHSEAVAIYKNPKLCYGTLHYIYT